MSDFNNSPRLRNRNNPVAAHNGALTSKTIIILNERRILKFRRNLYILRISHFENSYISTDLRQRKPENLATGSCCDHEVATSKYTVQ